jgi:YbbR domain-containing protein
MFGNLKNRISSFFKSESNNKKLSTYALFLFISFSFWFLSMLSKQHETTLKVPVEYVNFSPDKVLVSTPVSFIEVRIKAPGFSILFYNLMRSSKLNLDIQQANTKPKKGGSEVFWLMNSKRKHIAKILSSSMELIAITPERLIIPFSNKAKKKVAVKLQRSIDLSPEIWFAKPIDLLPDSVMIYGKKEQLDAVDFIETEELLLVDVSESSKHSLLLNIPIDVQCKIENIEVVIDVEPFVEQLIKYQVEARNLKKGYSIRLFPELVQVTLRAPKDKYSMLQTDFLKLKVDASLISDQNRRLEIEVENLPSFIQLQRVYPSSVEFLLIKD